MISFQSFTLKNGLQVIHHNDPLSKLCVLNLLYKVGSKDEQPNKTGFAHLFEHLMFGGSKNAPEFDTVLQMASGDNNAFTSNDITNYYITLPSNNIETAFWLESDRMLNLTLNQETLDIQKDVVIEEFKERYINQPYGDVWLRLLPLAYQTHPYSWPTIGKNFEHIEKATLHDVANFFKNFYMPNNAILVISGNISLDDTKLLTEKWFADIPAGSIIRNNKVVEPKQTSARKEHVYADVPLNLIVIGFHIGGRLDPDYYATDLLSDIMGGGKSARLYNNLLKTKKLFSEIDCYLSGDFEPGLFIIEGKLCEGVSFETAENAIYNEIKQLINGGVFEDELQKVKNKAETNIRFNDSGVLNKAMKLAYAAYYGDPNLANTEADQYLSVQKEELVAVAQKYLLPENSNTLYYHAKNQGSK